MNFYKFSKVTIFLITGILLACSPNKQKVESDKVTGITNETSSQGMKVYIDPDTKKFLDTSPDKTVATKQKTVKTNQNNNNSINTSQDKKTTYQEKKSTTPGGGIYIDIPPP